MAAFQAVQADEPRIFTDPVTLITHYRNTRREGWYASVAAHQEPTAMNHASGMPRTVEPPGRPITFANRRTP